MIKKKNKKNLKKKSNKSKKNKQKNESKENEEPEEKTVKYTIIVGRNGLNGFQDIPDASNDKSENNAISNAFNDQSLNDKTFRKILKLNETHLAITSNSILQGGENKLIIYNLAKRKTKETIEGYSFIASGNGLEIIEENVLLCACKKYYDNQKNGILLVNLNYEEDTISKTHFYNMQEFEVYCFCIIKEKNTKIDHSINDQTKFYKRTAFFFVGGFDNVKREGRIKLFKFVTDSQNNITGIKYIQDIEINRTLIEDKKENQKSQENIVKNEKTVIEEDKEEENIIDPFNFNGFKGAISSIIQSDKTQNILVSCYDGKIYLLSKPNLEAFTKNSSSDKLNIQ